MIPYLLLRLRRTPPHRILPKLARWSQRLASARYRRWSLHRSRGELSDAAFLAAMGGRFKTTDAAVRHFRERMEPNFFVNPATASEYAGALAETFPQQTAAARRAGQQALNHVVDLLGSGPTALGSSIPWLVDFKTGMSWPVRFFEDIEYHRLDAPCDVKVPWELSRCYHWVALGRAYALDPDSRYATEFIAQLASWLDANPYPYTVNWGRAMEAAIRAVNWLWALSFFENAPELTDAMYLRLLKSLVQHARHIAANLEFSDNNGNHYLSNGVGLSFLGICLPESVESQRWRTIGAEIVWGELQRQVSEDGVDFEKGIGYQGLVLEFWYSVLLLQERNGIPVPDWVRPRLERMFEFVLAYTRPDGSFPQIGDNDDGRLAGLDDEPVGSHQRHLAVGGAILNRPDLLAAAGVAVGTALWLTGPAVLTATRLPTEPASQAFPQGGFYVLRARSAVMVVDAGEVGMNGIGAHGHNDMLAYDLWAAGSPALVDPGTYTYTADPAMRETLRATAAHNTVRVDGQEMARLGGVGWPWRIENDALPTVHRWRSAADRDTLVASHSGYSRLSQPVIHRRSIVLHKINRIWSIEDQMEGLGEHHFEVYLHPYSAEVLRETEGLCARLRLPEADLVVIGLGMPGGTVLRIDQGWVSTGYGYRAPAPVLAFACTAPAPVVLRHALLLVSPGTSFGAARSLFEHETAAL